MRLTRFTNFTLRTLQLLALRAPALVTVEQVARAHGISKAHLVKTANALAQRGYVTTVRGRGGGMRLARPAESITVGEIVRWTEGPLDLVECFSTATSTWPATGACHLSRGFQRALRAFLSVLDDLTVADIALNRDQLLARLAAPGMPAMQVEPARVHGPRAGAQ